ncbi:GlcG/HbpS family heme-binding protein [Protaetiibacter intestinalis]|uniref:Heme-binding protein n=1 Tax=Protaetiibacter intestinalis TaxID=2419774 RepID=A0A387B8A8_9MICO|nr:heme-binding protein [Protaetiibacter intestinalis]AYF97219.1 heme-binding protein [Protaetiibacter intestinalis]
MAMAQISPIILSLEIAHKVTAAAIAKVEAIGIPYTLSVVDGAGNLVHLTRLDGAAIASIDTSVAKARTSVYFGAPTADLAAAVSDGAPLATIQTSTTAHLAFVAGGVPIIDQDGVVIGGFGAGGGSPEQDHEVAYAAVAALKA